MQESIQTIQSIKSILFQVAMYMKPNDEYLFQQLYYVIHFYKKILDVPYITGKNNIFVNCDVLLNEPWANQN